MQKSITSQETLGDRRSRSSEKHPLTLSRFIALLAAIATLMAGCSEPIGPDNANRAPAISLLTAQPDDLPAGGRSTLTCVAIDPDDDGLTYEWRVPAGSVTGSGPVVTWTAPLTAASVTMTVLVADGRGGFDSDTLLLSVHVNPRMRVLVDATGDGGVWWYPQSENTGFDPAKHHQGRALADVMRDRGFQVDELPRGIQITDSLLNQYDRVIRVGSRCSYDSESKLQAYEAFLDRPTSLILISEFLRPNEQDRLAERLGLSLAGVAYGSVTRFASHPITQGATPFFFNAGAVVMNAATNPNIEILGWLSEDSYADMNGNQIQDPGEPTGPPVMGILHHPTAKVFFLGEINGLETVPQPLVNNLLGWAFE